ncbi:hypothetical protein PROFUN_08171 [Planoprotostelium fungivorum]|uniref:Uncharacterized protein n=1 Tax=Planoprotostelium fungivorum TaxID=1890364 RepID=A0A2P6N632_9EUKA|nr:hypothetical protein PROFUN_08171 [Planoprotostelium fungivorum]
MAKHIPHSSECTLTTGLRSDVTYLYAPRAPNVAENDTNIVHRGMAYPVRKSRTVSIEDDKLNVPLLFLPPGSVN